jgi:hypothetical protein
MWEKYINQGELRYKITTQIGNKWFVELELGRDRRESVVHDSEVLAVSFTCGYL